MTEEPRTLYQICEESPLNMTLLGNVYCRAGVGKKVDCEYQSDIKDNNGLYPCYDPRFHKEKWVL